MRLRPFSAANLKQCAALLPADFDRGGEVRARLPEIWHDLARGHLLNGSVTEDTATPDTPIAAFGMSVFLDPRFVDACLRRAEPGVAWQVYRAIIAGQSPVLRVPEIARANAGEGLDLLVLHYWQHDLDLSRPRAQGLLVAGHAGFRLAHEGFRIKRAFQEAFTPEHVAFLKAGGFLEKLRYAGTNGHGVPAGWLMGLSRTDAESQLVGTTVSFLFRDAEARFGFSLGEQRLLHRCLLDTADTTGAAGHSPNTVKKLWQSIYARVEAVDPQVVNPRGLDTPGAAATRGPEKRRHLLNYLRYHMEELRPRVRRRR